MHDPTRIKNFCVLAHVDHGKTTLCDYLISSNGIIAPSLAGELRFMDSRADEQEKHITVKTSVISLTYENSIFNVIDSPGHFDFTSEVSIALRLCESAFVLIDVLDGVTNQTEYLIRNAYAEGVDMCVVFSKIDLLFTVMKLTTKEMEDIFVEILAKCNALLSGLVAEEGKGGTKTATEISAAEDYFVPSKGNVLFTSAKWGVGFSIGDFARMYHAQRQWSVQTLRQTLWGQYTFDDAKKRIVKLKIATENTQSLFERFVLAPIDELVRCFENSSGPGLNALAQVIHKIPCDASLQTPDVSSYSLETFLNKWCPLDKCLMYTVQNVFHSAKASQSQHYRRLISNELLSGHEQGDVLSATKMLQALQNCANKESPAIAFVVKVTETSIDNKRKLIALCKILSGNLSNEEEVFLWSSEGRQSSGIIRYIGLFQGNDLIRVPRIGAGNICAIEGDFVQNIVKFGTIADQPLAAPIVPMRILYPSVFRTVVRPSELADRVVLGQALQTLNALDLQLDVNIEDNGDFVLGTAGVVHTERCVTDLKDIARVSVDVSDPVIPLMETIHNYRLPVPTEGQESAKKRFYADIRAFGLSERVREAIDGSALPENSLQDLFDNQEIGITKDEFLKHYNCHRGKRGNVLFVRRRAALSLAYGQNDLMDILQSAFHIAMKQGPLAKLPVTGVCMIVHDVRKLPDNSSLLDNYIIADDERHELMNTLQKAFLQELQSCISVLVEPCYACEITVKSDAPLGKIYALISERRGRIISEEQTFSVLGGHSRFVFLAKIPVSESQKVIDAIHYQSCGQANCQFFSSGWEDIVDYSVEEAQACDKSAECSGGRPRAGTKHDERPSYVGNTSWSLLEKLWQSKGLMPQIQLPKDAEKQKFANRAA